MDYVVAGFGIGAVLALIGFALWELFGNSEEPGQGWLVRAAIGFMLGALVIWAVTGVSLISTIDDSTGSRIVLITSLITLLSIVGGSAWYWRADQAMLEAMPPQKRARKPTQQPAAGAAVASPQIAGDGDMELSEWDSWPEREAGESEVAPSQTTVEPRFEPEVAVEAAEPLDSPAQSWTNEKTIEHAEIVVEDTVIQIAVDPKAILNEKPASASEAEEPDAPIDADEQGPSEPTALAAEPELEVEPEPEPEPEPVPEPEILPKNVRRLRPIVAPAEKPAPPITPEPKIEIDAEQNSVAVVESIDVIEVDAVEEPAVPAEEPESEAHTEPPQENAAIVPVLPEKPLGFESSLLADIDVTTAEGSGRYRSPLLADLDPNPDELEGLGLAKWRPEARLTAVDQEEEPPEKARRRR